jgi:hypothetical protein
MNSDDVPANGENMMHHHVMDVFLDKRSFLVEVLVEMITHGDGIWR